MAGALFAGPLSAVTGAAGVVAASAFVTEASKELFKVVVEATVASSLGNSRAEPNDDCLFDLLDSYHQLRNGLNSWENSADDVDEETARFIMRRSIYGLLQAADEASDVPAKEGLWINAKLMLDCIAPGIPEALTSRVDTFPKEL